MALVESYSKGHRWPVWSGTQSDFLRLLRLVATQFEPFRPAYVANKTRYARDAVTRIEQSVADIRSDIRSFPKSGFEGELTRRQADLRKAKQDLKNQLADAESEATRIDLALTSRGDEVRRVSGTADELVQWMEGKPFESIELSAPSGRMAGNAITLRAARHSGLRLSVSSLSDARWGIAAYSEISAEIKRRVPAWRFIRWFWFPWTAYFLTLTPAVWFAMDTIAQLTTSSGNFDSPEVASAVFVIISVGLVISASILTDRFIPAFEILSGSQRAKAASLFAAYGSAVVAVVLGVITNIVSRYIGY